MGPDICLGIKIDSSGAEEAARRVSQALRHMGEAANQIQSGYAEDQPEVYQLNDRFVSDKEDFVDDNEIAEFIGFFGSKAYLDLPGRSSAVRASIGALVREDIGPELWEKEKERALRQKEEEERRANLSLREYLDELFDLDDLLYDMDYLVSCLKEAEERYNNLGSLSALEATLEVLRHDLNLIVPGMGQPQPSQEQKKQEAFSKEAEVQCKTCKGKKWVGWEHRHNVHKCTICKIGQDDMKYTGHFR